MLVHNAETNPNGVGYAKRDGDGWADVTHSEFLAQVESLAKGFIAAGIEHGDRVALLSRTRFEWTLVDFALLSVGAIVVPIYETSSPDQISWIIRDSGAVAAVLETEEHRKALATVRDELTTLRDVWQIDSGHLEELAEGAAEVTDSQMRARRDAVDADAIATVIYTSGTTGRPKGCALTHSNFVATSENCLAVMHELVEGESNGTLLFLPLAHVFARLIQYVAVSAGVRLGHAHMSTLVDDMGSFKPSFLLAVPRVFEKVYNGVEHQAQVSGKEKVFKQAARVAINYSRAQDAGKKAALSVRLQHFVFDKLVYAKLRAAFGGELRYSISGGAPLSAHLAHFFNGAGVIILEGWGLTETTAPATVNLPHHRKIGTVGPAIPGVELKIADDDEILVKGINVFREYINNEEATVAARGDGWFHTGDLGQLDDEGYLRITGRKKDLIITAGGKNVSPSKLEDSLRSNPLVAEAVVVGDNKPFIGALITLDEEMLGPWAANRDIDASDPEAIRRHPQVLATIQEAVDEANSTVSRAESIRKFVILPGQFTEESGHMTPSLKVKRHIVLTDYATEIEELYSGKKP